jgi:5'-phosphate synthase pdxT subunit
MTVVGVLALQGDVREHELALARCGVQTRKVRNPADLDGIDAIVIPGGESTTMSLLAVTNGMVEPLRSRIASGLPAYGSCAGMIMLAAKVVDGRADQQTFGGLDVVVRRNAFGRQVDSFESELAMKCLGDPPLHAVFIRAPWVESIGPDVEVLATIESGPATGRIVAVRQGPVLATSFHPELTGDPRVHRYFVEMVKQR